MLLTAHQQMKLSLLFSSYKILALIIFLLFIVLIEVLDKNDSFNTVFKL